MDGDRPAFARNVNVPGAVNEVIRGSCRSFLAEWRSGQHSVFVGNTPATGIFPQIAGYKSEAKWKEATVLAFAGHDGKSIPQTDHFLHAPKKQAEGCLIKDRGISQIAHLTARHALMRLLSTAPFLGKEKIV